MCEWRNRGYVLWQCGGNAKERLVNDWAFWDVLLDGARGKKTRSAIICESDLSGEKDSRDGECGRLGGVK